MYQELSYVSSLYRNGKLNDVSRLLLYDRLRLYTFLIKSQPCAAMIKHHSVNTVLNIILLALFMSGHMQFFWKNCVYDKDFCLCWLCFKHLHPVVDMVSPLKLASGKLISSSKWQHVTGEEERGGTFSFCRVLMWKMLIGTKPNLYQGLVLLFENNLCLHFKQLEQFWLKVIMYNISDCHLLFCICFSAVTIFCSFLKGF